ncbi:MAG: peptide chain release factor aRF-1 [Desulfurococcales archaeon]|nr:peptide chain release factor aRF-1 [Desulfurococcales archaeon]
MEKAETRLEATKKDLQAIIKELKQWKAPATVLLSLYIPPGRPLSDVMNMLKQELSITDNIKLKRTREAVQRALSAAMDRLSKISKVPPNGLVAFCGQNVDTGDFVCYVFSPPEKVPVYFYRTDKEFHLEFLEDMLEEKDVIGIIIVERDEATIGILQGSKLEVLEEVSDYIPGKHKMGGQSQRRYDRIIEQMVSDFFKRVAERANKYFLPYLEQGRLKGIIVAGPGYAKQDFLSTGNLDYRLRKLVSKQLVDVAYQGIQGLKETVMKAEDVIETQIYRDAINALEEFKLHLAKDTGMAVYGEREVLNALRSGMLKYLLIHEDRDDLDHLVEEAKNFGTKPVVIPQSIPEAEWLKTVFDGLAGVLRFKPR